jgi:serine/threonine-protein kinase
LEYLQSRRLVHRDIKPGNILLTTSGVAKLSDLGLVKPLDEFSELTASHQAFGTSWYMPYEQVLNARLVDGRSDLFALGATIYHLLTGTPPFPGKDHAEITLLKERGHYTPASQINSSVPPDLERILARMLAREPRDRFATAAELVVALERSQLADQLPSFVDIDLAMRDPEARARITSSNQPTSPDLRLAEPEGATGDSGVIRQGGAGREWLIRFVDARGQAVTRRATTNQILHGLREGYWPEGIEAARAAGGRFRAISDYPEFRRLAPPPSGIDPDAPLPERLLGLRQWKVLLSAAFGIGILAAASVAAIYRFLLQL